MFTKIPLLYLYPLHVIFMSFWIAGLFFIGRLFVYHKEAESEKEIIKTAFQEKYSNAIQKTLKIITWPSLVLTYFFGLCLTYQLLAFKQSWFHSKMLFVLLLTAYTFFCQFYVKKIRKNHIFNAKVLRMINELPGLILILIVFTVYVKSVKTALIFLGIFTLLLGFTFSMISKFKKKKV